MVDWNGSGEAGTVARHVIDDSAILSLARLFQATVKAGDERMKVDSTVFMELRHDQIAKVRRVHALTVEPHRHHALAAVQVVSIVFLWVKGEGTEQLEVVADHEISNRRFCTTKGAVD